MRFASDANSTQLLIKGAECLQEVVSVEKRHQA